MVFGGITKKLSKKRTKTDLAISDPGSDDSWAALYQTENISKSVAKEGSTKKSPPKAASPAPPKAASPACPSKATSPASTQVKEAIDDERKESELQNSVVTKGKKTLAFTSTPFVKHKKAPVFEFSSIISPIDVTSDGHPEQSLLSANSTASLVVNRKNPTKPTDETFNQLLNPGNKVPKQTSALSGIKPLKSVINQADTTRQYAGGAVRGGRKNHSENLHKTNVDSSWETAEEVTYTSESKKTVSSPSKVTQRSLRSSKTEIKLSNAENDEGNGNPPSDGPKSSDNANIHNDQNKMQQMVGDVKSCRKSSRRSRQAYPPDEEGDPVSEDISASIIKDGVILLNEEDKASDIQIGACQSNVRKDEINQMPSENASIRNTNTLDTVTNKEFEGTQLRKGSKFDEEKSVKLQKKIPESRKPRSNSTFRSSKAETIVQERPCEEPETSIPTENKISEKSRVVSTETAPGEGLIEAVQQENNISEKSRVVSTQIFIDRETGAQNNKNSNNKSCGKRLGDKEEDKGDYSSNFQLKGNGDAKKPHASRNRGDSNTVIRQITEAESLRTAPVKELIEAVQQENPISTFYQRSDFAVQIGNICLKQSSCIGFSLNSKQTRSAEDQELNFNSKDSTEVDRLENSSDIPQRRCLSQNASSPGHQEKKLAITSQQKSETGETSTMERNSTDLLTASKNTTNQPEKVNDIITESSSEEERILLRAQSLRLREKQSNVSRISKISKSHDIGPIGVNTHRSGLRNLSLTGTSDLQQKSPVKFLPESKQLETQEKVQQKVVQLVHPISTDTDNCQTYRPAAVECSAVGDETRSSCDELVLISRNPPDCNNSFDDDNFEGDNLEDDNFELEIMSSSEEEQPNKPTKQVFKTKAVAEDVNLQKNNVGKNSKQLSKGRNLSLKVKEIRRRREKIIDELLRSKRESSDSDSEHVLPPEMMNNVGNDKQSKEEVGGVKQSQKLRKKFNGKAREVHGLNSSEGLEEGPVGNSKSKARQVIEDRSEQSHSNISSKSKEVEQTLMPEGQNNFNASGASKPTPIQNIESEVEEAHEEQDFLHSSLGKRDPNEEEQEEAHLQAHEEHFSSSNQLDEAAFQKAKERETQKEKTRAQSSKIGYPLTSDLKKSKEQNKIATRKHNIHDRNAVNNEVDASGLRCSRRKRHAPTMYWLGQRTRYKVLENGCQEAVDESMVTSRTKLASLETQTQSISAKSVKRKIEKGNKTEAKTSKRIRQTNQSRVPRTNPKSSADNDRVLVYEADVLSESDGQYLSCNIEEVKERKCVSGCGVKGDLIALGVGASIDKQMPSHFNQVYYVLEGEISCKFTNGEKTLAAGSFFIVPRGEVCHVKNKWNSTVKLVLVSCTA